MMKQVRFRTLGCYPLTGAIESNADDAAGDHPGDAAGAHLRARRAGSSTTTRPRRWSRRSRKDTSDERTTSSSCIDARTCRGLPRRRQRAAKSLLRFITCGSVDDGKSTLIGRLLHDSKLIFEDQLAALEADSKKAGTQGGRDRLRAAARRPGGRARAGHHHRRRLPLLLDRASATSSSPTRPATSSTRATWSPAPRPPTCRHPDRRAQRRADADPAPQLPRLAARHPPRRAGGQQDGPRRLRRRRRVRRDRGRLPRLRRAHSASTTSRAFPSRRSRATTSSSRATVHALVPRADADGATWRRWRSTRTRDAASCRSACRCSG